MTTVVTSGYAARSATSGLAPYVYASKLVGATDVHVSVHFCGICHSDLHQVRNEWGGNSIYPMVPGHEVVGIVEKVGSKVTKFKVGDRVGVGCFVDSCGNCTSCKRDLENYCPKKTMTYNSKYADGTVAYGGYARDIVCREEFVLKIPDNLPLAEAAPLLCAGITTYSPMKHWHMDKPGTRVGVVGLGGLGHMAVKFCKVFGCETTVISTSDRKRDEALSLFGADHYIVSSDKAAMAAAAGSLDFIIDTAAVPKDMEPYFSLLDINGTLVAVGIPSEKVQISPVQIICQRCSYAGSLVGGIKETQEMLNLCATKNITPIIEKIPMDKANEAYERMLKSDVRYRFVLCVKDSCPEVTALPDSAKNA